MHDIRDYHMIHKGKIVTILANGPSLLRFSQMVGEGDLTLPKEITEGDWVGINYSFEKIGGPDRLKYIFIQELETYYKISKVVPNNKLVLPVHPGLNKHGTADRVKVVNSLAIGYVLQDPMKNKPYDLPRKYYGIQKETHFFCYTTTFQTCLHVLCYMGYKKIYLVGVDYKMFNNGKIHYDSETDPNYGNQQMNALNRFKEGDDYLIPKLMEINKVNILNIGPVL